MRSSFALFVPKATIERRSRDLRVLARNLANCADRYMPLYIINLSKHFPDQGIGP
ncbi:MAG: hypothetical protein LUQ38_11710 [Methanotrichaceae archaeon]|nr:hypothetical protein [Methanotrichaceae archaeon]MDD1758613.1 hypothetical protein [Methanotrichaceae archaeon]